MFSSSSFSHSYPELGDAKTASELFARALREAQERSGGQLTAEWDCRAKMNDGFLEVCRGNYAPALKHFESVVSLCAPLLASRESAPAARAAGDPFDFGEDLQALSPPFTFSAALREASTNAAICMLYQEKLSEAVASLEALVRENPRENLTQPVLFNLATLYDLVSSNARERKRVLLEIAGLVAKDELDTTMLRS